MTIPCETCGTPTEFESTKRCNYCWEVESRLAIYLRDGGEKARAFVRVALTVAFAQAGAPDPRDLLGGALERFVEEANPQNCTRGVNGLLDALDRYLDARDARREENASLTKALERYGDHLPECAYTADQPCNCGLFAALGRSA